MKRLLILILVSLMIMLLVGCNGIIVPATSLPVQSSNTTLRSPFNGDGNWYLTQLFGAYYKNSSLGIDGHHPGEDWNFASGDGDANKNVYPIAPGTVVGGWPVSKGDTQGSEAGFYIVVKHTGTFNIPGSSGANIQSLSKPEHETGRASNYGKPVVHSKDLFSAGALTEYDMGEKTDNGSYSYKGESVSTIYSVYMHINDPREFINSLGSDKEITGDMLDKPIGSLKGDMSSFPSHLHFEIRIGNSANITASSLPGNKNGYYANSQNMVDAGYREPSSVIQANRGQGSISGEVMGTETSNHTLKENSASAQNKAIDITGQKKVNGEIKVEDQVIIYTYTPSISGIFEFDIESVNNNIWIETRDNSDSRVDAGYGRNSAITLEEGKQYTIKLSSSEPSKYILNIGAPNKTRDISGQTEVNDEFRYESQVITYTYTPSISGIFEFDIESDSSDSTIWMETLDNSDSRVDAGYYGKNVITLEAKKQYTIKLSTNESCEFSLNIAIKKN